MLLADAYVSMDTNRGAMSEQTIEERYRTIKSIAEVGGRGEAALRRIIEAQDELVISKPILDESLCILA